MLILTTHEAVTNAIERYSQIVPVGILQRYAAMLKEEPIVRLFILQPGDSAELLAQLRGQPFELWEFIVHTNDVYEVVWITSDYGEGDAALIPDHSDIDAELLSLCRQHATEAELSDASDI